LSGEYSLAPSFANVILSEAKDLNQTIVSISSEKLGAARLVFKLWFSLAFAFVAAAF
jgi:hypothetical protein